MMRAELHDGTVLEFPDGTDPTVIQATVKKHLSVQQAPSLTAGPNRALSPVGDTLDKSAPFWTTLRASLAPDVKDQIKRFASSMGIPEQRFGVIDGNIVYADDKGDINRVTPSVFENARGPLDAFMRAGRWAASGFGPSIPQAAAGVVGTMMGPTPASIPAAGAVAAGTDVVRQGVDRAIAGESVFNIDPLNAAGQGALGMIGQGGAVGVIKALSRNPLGVSAYDAAKALDPNQQKLVSDLMAEAQRRGIDLSAGQATGMRSLLARERQLGRYDETADQMYDFANRQRTQQVPQAFRAEVSQISPSQGGQQAISDFRSGAEAAQNRVLDQRNARAKIMYEQALDRPDRFWNEDIDKLMSRPSVEKGIGYARLIAKEEGRDITVPVFENGKMVGRDVVPDWRSWDYIKRGIDRVIEENTDQFGRVNAYGRAASNTKRELLGFLDAENPAYGTARAAYGQSSDAVETVLNGGVGAINKMEGMDRTALVNRFFSRQNILPEEVEKARSQFVMAGKLDDWNAGLSAWLSDRLDDALKVNVSGSPGNVPGKLYGSIWGDERQQKIVKAALGDPARIQGMERLMEVLNAASKSLPEGSPTATDQVAATAGKTVGSGLKVLGKLTSPQTYWNIGDEIVSGIDALRTPQARIKLADALLSGDYAAELSKLRMFRPGSERAIEIASQILVGAGVSASGARRPADAAIPETRPLDPR
jgi:hypothetical protein